MCNKTVIFHLYDRHMSEKANKLFIRQGYNIRQIKDRLMSWFMGFGGISVIIAIVLIFFYKSVIPDGI